jgi:hypothetical protein
MLYKVGISLQDVLGRSTGRPRSKKCRTRFISYNPTQDLWRFKVTCSEKDSDRGGHEVNVWLEKNHDEVPGKLEFKAFCKCKAWQYYGSEFHAKSRDYLLGRPRGTGTAPRVRDPHRRNLVCKHVFLCLWEMMRGRKFF